jgi:hypothetical protein
LNLEAKQKEQAAVQKAKENDPYLVAVTDIDIDDAEENSNYLREQAEKYRTKESVDKLKEAYFKQYQLSKALWKDNDPEYNQFMQDYFETVKAWQIK